MMKITLVSSLPLFFCSFFIFYAKKEVKKMLNQNLTKLDQILTACLTQQRIWEDCCATPPLQHKVYHDSRRLIALPWRRK